MNQAAVPERSTHPLEPLLERWRQHRDARALGELLKIQRDRAFATAYRLLGHAADAEDAVQEAFVKLLTRTQGFESPEAFRVAVYRAVMQCALDLLRARRRRQDRERASTALNLEHVAPWSGDLDMATLSEHHERHTQLCEAIARLPDDLRAAVVLCGQQGLRLSDAAQVLEVPRQTLHDRLAKALKVLRGDMRRRGRVLSLALLGAWLEQEGAAAAPASLCAALDRRLPGRPCADLPAELPTLGAEMPVPWATESGGKAVLLGTGTFLTAALLMASFAGKGFGVSSNRKPEPRPVLTAEPPVRVQASEPGKENRSARMSRMKFAGALASATLALAPLAQAGDAERVDEILARIRAHVAEKAKTEKEACGFQLEGWRCTGKSTVTSDLNQGDEGDSCDEKTVTLEFSTWMGPPEAWLLNGEYLVKIEENGLEIDP